MRAFELETKYGSVLDDCARFTEPIEPRIQQVCERVGQLFNLRIVWPLAIRQMTFFSE